jgi:ribosomal protein L37AE/L43A
MGRLKEYYHDEICEGMYEASLRADAELAEQKYFEEKEKSEKEEKEEKEEKVVCPTCGTTKWFFDGEDVAECTECMTRFTVKTKSSKTNAIDNMKYIGLLIATLSPNYRSNFLDGGETVLCEVYEEQFSENIKAIRYFHKSKKEHYIQLCGTDFVGTEKRVVLILTPTYENKNGEIVDAICLDGKYYAPVKDMK